MAADMGFRRNMALAYISACMETSKDGHHARSEAFYVFSRDGLLNVSKPEAAAEVGACGCCFCSVCC